MLFQFWAQAALSDMGNASFDAALHTDMADAVTAGEGDAYATAQERIKDALSFPCLDDTSFIFQLWHRVRWQQSG